MNNYSNKLLVFLSLVLISCYGCAKAQVTKPTPVPPVIPGTDTATAIKVPLGGNAWLNRQSKAQITDSGLMNWSGVNDTANIYVRTEAPGLFEISLRLRVPDGESEIEVMCNKSLLSKKITTRNFALIDFGQVSVKQAGYLRIALKGIKRTGNIFAEVSDLVLTGTALSSGAVYVKNNHGSYYYWGRRGPSVHLSYKVPATIQNNIEWFYNEVTVPAGNDVQGSYFMSNGFAEGYFGMQVNSPTERHVLFSIWSPYSTNDPKSIPDSLKIKLLKKGPNVHTGEFGNEGSGGQSYMNYEWKAGQTYCFLTHAQPDAAMNSTIFTCYFKAITDNTWQLMASFKRPQTNNHLTQLYSFLENFDPEFGNTERKGDFGNGWIIDTEGNWHELTAAIFTGDATAQINYRKDYSGGTDGNLFYLRNCGFFNDFTKLNITLQRPAGNGTHPVIDFIRLP